HAAQVKQQNTAAEEISSGGHGSRSLPPCGEGWGGGYAKHSCLAVHSLANTPPLTPPHKSLRPGARKRGPGGEGNPQCLWRARAESGAARTQMFRLSYAQCSSAWRWRLRQVSSPGSQFFSTRRIWARDGLPRPDLRLAS